jgi:hypothetical protein
MNIKHVGRGISVLVFARVDAVDRADVHTRCILRSDTRFADDIRHRDKPMIAYLLRPPLPAMRGKSACGWRFDGFCPEKALP